MSNPVTQKAAIRGFITTLTIFFLMHTNKGRCDVFAHFATIDVVNEIATGQLNGVGFTLVSTRAVPIPGQNNGGIIDGLGTTNGTSTLFNSPVFTPPLPLGDAVALGAISDFRITFSQPVSNLTLHIYQLASNQLLFTSGGTPATFNLLSSDGDFTVLNGGTSIKGGDEGDPPHDNASGSLFFGGTFSELSWTATANNVPDSIHLQMSVGTAQNNNTDLLASIHFSAIDICWAGLINQMYQVQYTTNPSTTNWLNLGSAVPGSGTNCMTDGIVVEKRFYRVVRVP